MTARQPIPAGPEEQVSEVELLTNILRAAADDDPDALLWCAEHSEQIAQVLIELRRRRAAEEAKA